MMGNINQLRMVMAEQLGKKDVWEPITRRENPVIVRVVLFLLTGT